MKLTDEEWASLREAVAADDRERFDWLVMQHIRQTVRDILARREGHCRGGCDPSGRPWLAANR